MNIKLAIKSCWKNADRRQAQLDTWLKEWPHDFFFLVGSRSQHEFFDLTDCLMVNSSDEFGNIAPKVAAACSYALQEKSDFLVVVDDDTYLRPERLLACGFEKYDCMGFVRTSDRPYPQGSCFTLSRRAMEIIVTSTAMRNGVPDDVAVGQAFHGWNTEFYRDDTICIAHQPRFNVGEPYPKYGPERSNYWICAHKAAPDVMRRWHEAWK